MKHRKKKNPENIARKFKTYLIVFDWLRKNLFRLYLKKHLRIARNFIIFGSQIGTLIYKKKKTLLQSENSKKVQKY